MTQHMLLVSIFHSTNLPDLPPNPSFFVMVFLFEKFTTHTHKTSSKLKRHHSASLRCFEAEIMNCLHQLSLQSTPGSDACSLSWIQTCLRVLPSIEDSFMKFIAEVNYPVTEWKISLVEEHLKGSLSLLDHFNCISSSVNHISEACMELSYALSLTEASPTAMSENLKEILPWCNNNILQEEEAAEERVCSEKELVVYKAVLQRKRVNNRLCKTINSSICGGEIELECNGDSELVKKDGVLKEVAEINKGVVQLLAAAEEGRYCFEVAKELRGKVDEFRNLLEGVRQDVNRLFSQAMARRNELLCSFQNGKH